MSDINITIRLASKAAEQGLDSFGRAADGAGKRLSLFERAVGSTQRAYDSFIGNLGANLAFRAFNGVISGIGNTLTNLKQFETALIGVGKTTNLEGKALADLGQELQDLSRVIPVAATELLGMTQTAAQLGVKGTDNLVKFTDTMARLAVATDIVGEEGAIAFARIINITGESVGNIDRLGSSIVALGNNFAATERQILTVANEVAKGGARFGLTGEQVLGLSTAMSALGTEAQVAGSTTQKVFAQVEKAIGSGGKNLQQFTDILGLNREEFIKLFETRPDQFFLRLVKGLGESQKSGANLSNTLAKLGFQDLRVTKTLGPLINRTDLLTRALTTSSNAYRVNRALTEESEAAFSTLQSSLTKLDNNWIALTNTILNAVAPAFTFVTDIFSSLIKIITDYPKILKLVGITIAATATIITAGLVVVGTNAFLASAAFTALAASATTAWASILLPITAVVAGVAAVAGAFVLLSDATDKDRLATLQAARERRVQSGLAVDDINKEIKALENKIRIQEVNSRIAQGAAVGENSVLQTQIKSVETLNDRLFRQAGIRLDLQKITGEAGRVSVLRAQAELDAENRAEETRIADQKTRDESRLKRLNERGLLENAIKLEQLRAGFIASDELSTEQEEFLLEKEANAFALRLEREQEFLARKLLTQDEADALELKNKATQIKRKNDIDEKAAEAQKKLDANLSKARVDTFSATANLITAVSKDGSKAAFLISKAAAVAQSIVSGRVATALALANPPGPPLTVPLAAQVSLASNINTAAIIATAIKGFQDGGIVGGNSFSGDNVLARVNSGEMILNQQQQSELFNQANGAGAASGGGGDIVVQIDGQEVFRAVSRQVANGAVLGEGGV